VNASATPTDPAVEPAATDMAPPPGSAPERPATLPWTALFPPRGWALLGVLFALAVAGIGMAWRAEQRLASVEQELVRRQQDSSGQSAEARMVAKQAQDGLREVAAKLALVEARVAEVAIQRGQLEDLIQSLSRSRDENMLVDIDAALRVAMQQSAITGSAEPLVATLRQSDERLARYSQPRLEGVRRAAARDLDRIRSVGVTDIAALTIKLDEAARMVDELPLLATAEPRKDGGKPSASPATPNSSPAPAASSAGAGRSIGFRLPPEWIDAWETLAQRIWAEVRSLVRVTRIDHPEAMLLVPDQAYFVKENLKLRLLNARLALLSRQFETAQADLAVAQSTLERFFDRNSRRTQIAAELVRQVSTQARQVIVPRPDNTLAALAAATAGR
jgi:uroporphyrin-3 C-methyltransferase